MSLVRSETLIDSLPAVADSVPLARRKLVDFASLAGAVDEQLEEIRLAASEALTNVVMHAYREGQGRIHVRADVVAGELWILIGDDGAGLRPRTDSPGLGVGLALIAKSSDGLTIAGRAAGGTEVRMRFTLGRGDTDDQDLGSRLSAISPASPRFSTTT